MHRQSYETYVQKLCLSHIHTLTHTHPGESLQTEETCVFQLR